MAVPKIRGFRIGAEAMRKTIETALRGGAKVQSNLSRASGFESAADIAKHAPIPGEDLDDEPKIEDDKETTAELADLNRLITRAARRCCRDLGHAISHIPVESPAYKSLNERHNMWLEVFWDTKYYRDELHHEIYTLEQKVAQLKKQLADNGIKELPF